MPCPYRQSKPQRQNVMQNKNIRQILLRLNCNIFYPYFTLFWNLSFLQCHKNWLIGISLEIWLLAVIHNDNNDQVWPLAVIKIQIFKITVWTSVAVNVLKKIAKMHNWFQHKNLMRRYKCKRFNFLIPNYLFNLKIWKWMSKNKTENVKYNFGLTEWRIKIFCIFSLYICNIFC